MEKIFSPALGLMDRIGVVSYTVLAGAIFLLAHFVLEPFFVLAFYLLAAMPAGARRSIGFMQKSMERIASGDLSQRAGTQRAARP